MICTNSQVYALMADETVYVCALSIALFIGYTNWNSDRKWIRSCPWCCSYLHSFSKKIFYNQLWIVKAVTLMPWLSILKHLYPTTISDGQLVGKWRIQDIRIPMAHLPSQAPAGVSGSRIERSPTPVELLQEAAVFSPLQLAVLLVTDIKTHEGYHHTAFGWTCSKSNTSNIKRRTSGLPYTQYASPCNACWTEVVEGFLRRRLWSNLSCTDSP